MSNPYPVQATTGRRFVKGQSGNPGGRPKQVLSLLKYCRRRSKKALALCFKLVEDELTDADWEPKERVAYQRLRLEAAKFLANYGMGAPPKYDAPTDAPPPPVVERLTREQLEAIAATKLSTELPPDEPGTEH